MAEHDFPAFIYYECCPLADPGEWRAFAHNAECLGYLGVGIKIGTHGEMHGPDGMLLPGEMAVDRIGAYVQDLDIERGELLTIGVERRQLFTSSRGPIQRMKSDQHIFFPRKSLSLTFSRCSPSTAGSSKSGAKSPTFNAIYSFLLRRRLSIMEQGKMKRHCWAVALKINIALTIDW